ncbi:MAG: peptidylprolyl isomerase [Saprospiraceae bacterium]
MCKQFCALFAGLFLSVGIAFSQTNDPVLFKVEDTPVNLSEFKYIYSKTNQNKADFSRESLEEYLRLYVNFKLKVHKAKEMQLDTVPQTKNELAGYRRQLANSYLVDKEVTDKLVEEVYQHMLKDVDLSYIFFACDKNASAAESEAVYAKAKAVYDKIKAGADFDAMAVEHSEDESAKQNKGRLGYITAMFPDGFYELEKGAYAAKPGEVFGPVRTSVGYNIVRVNNFREARGEMEVAHILIRTGENPADAAKAKLRIDSAYAALQGGMKWSDACLRFSEDQMTKGKEGYIGFFGINRYQRDFEDAAYGLKADNDFSKPVETTIGWHIIKRISHRPIQSFEKLKRPLTERVKRDSRSSIAKESMIARIQEEGGFKEYPEVLKAWSAIQVDSIFHTFRWKPSDDEISSVVFSYKNGPEYTLSDFEFYCAKASRERMRGKGFPIDETIAKLYKSWKDDCAMQFEETQLDKKYPEFRSLMREYEEGILLFEAAKRLVWDRANSDSTGLQAYFDANLSTKYMWDERARVSFYTIKTTDAKTVEKIRKYMANKSAEDVLKKFNKTADNELVAVLEKSYEKGKNTEVDAMWKSGAMSAVKTDEGTKTSSFIKVEEIVPPTPKKLEDARGYAVAEYQDYLEKQWVKDLRNEYKVEINQQVFESMIKK